MSGISKGLDRWFKFNGFCREQAQLTRQDKFPATYLKSFGKSVTEHIGIISHILVKEQ